MGGLPGHPRAGRVLGGWAKRASVKVVRPSAHQARPPARGQMRAYLLGACRAPFDGADLASECPRGNGPKVVDDLKKLAEVFERGHGAGCASAVDAVIELDADESGADDVSQAVDVDEVDDGAASEYPPEHRS